VTLQLRQPYRILPPLLAISYAEVKLAGGEGDILVPDPEAAQISSSFVASYTMVEDDTQYIVSILFVISIVLWVVGTLFLVYLQLRRNQGQVVDGAFMVGALAKLCRVFSDVFFLFLFGCAGWTYVLFKGQTDIFMMMPTGNELLYPFQVIMICVFGAKCLHLLELIWRQTQHDVFFVDWEEPKGGVSGLEAAEGDRDSARCTVSTWRLVLVSNEWVKLQTTRGVSVELSLTALLFLLQGLEIEDFATLVPGGRGEEGVPPDMVLRFALSSFLLIVLGFSQWLVHFLLWDRFVQDRVWQFVDLLSLANVSCFIIEEQLHGYYLHGRSVHACADTDMLSLNKQLKREEEQLCAKRGLQSDSDVQSFEVYLSRGVREMFNEAFAGATFAGAAQGPAANVAGRSNQRRGFHSTSEDALRKHAQVTSFLTAFISGTLERHTLDIRPMAYWERRVFLPPEIPPQTTKSLFVEDPSGRFRSVLLIGHELDFVLLHALTYGVFDMLFVNSFIAIFATYVVDIAITFLRHHLGLRNIAQKTLLDKRFLM